MSQPSLTLAKQPTLKPAEDFYHLRREGIGFIEQLASQLWTDYNTHDPGITTLEALCYAITDVAYRLGWDIKDILAPENVPVAAAPPYPHQAFFTARDILTVNPTTPDDFRRLLIDLQNVRNAWIVCKQCACEVRYYAWCENSELVLSYQQPVNADLSAQSVAPLGLYDVLLELESDPELGDLNDRKIANTINLRDSGSVHTIIAEWRFQDMSLSNGDQWALLLDRDDAFEERSGEAIGLELRQFGATKKYDVFGDKALDDGARDAYVRKHWNNIFYVSLGIVFYITVDGKLVPAGKEIVVEYATLRLFSDVAAKSATTAKKLREMLVDNGRGKSLHQYRKKAKAAQAAVASAKATLLAHRNLDEDYCSIKVVGIEEVAVCADVEVQPDADIERVQARIWFELEQYFNPPVRFHTLQELLDSGVAVEDIFNGPALDSGFIKDADLAAAALKTVLRVSDIVNRLMDIDGVIAVNQLLLTKYDVEGNVIKGAADPSWHDGNPVFDANRTSASWLLFVSVQHQPRLYLNLSRFLFYKNGLPFRPRMDEARDTLNELRGEAERPKNIYAQNDVSIPKGNFKKPEDYYPVQYSFPLAYGTGPEGLPANAPPLRKAQAKQFKAYLMVFEQLLGNALAQLAHTADLFSLNPEVKRSYFVKEFSEQLIQGFDEIKKGLNKQAVESISETLPEFYERRNRFLDHLLARFGEQFGEYALLLSNVAGKQVAQARLIDDKIAFLTAYPMISHDRAKAFDYTRSLYLPDNQPGIKKRISLLLGYPNLEFAWTVTDVGSGNYRLDFQLCDSNKKAWMTGSVIRAAANEAEAQQLGYRYLIEQMLLAENYEIVALLNKWRLNLKDSSAAVFAHSAALFDSKADAAAMQDELLAWSANERLIVVEHLLLRPKFVGDALYPACVDGRCQTCGDEDPYSFRLTFVMPGWTTLYTDNLDMRRFAERTIQQETPSHLLGKTCWVGNDGFIDNPCDDVIGVVAEWLMTKGLTAGGTSPSEEQACDCAKAIYHAYSGVFKAWYADKMLEFIHPQSLSSQITALFSAHPQPADIACSIVLDAGLWTELKPTMVAHFRQIAVSGWQFERFESAWFQWLKANATFAWTQERLHERVQEILKTHWLPNSAANMDVCECATDILGQCGVAFYNWMENNIKTGDAFGDWPEFSLPAIDGCAGVDVTDNFIDAIGTLLTQRYRAYTEVSYRLRVVVKLLSELGNTYPGAFLHDCDDGSDRNPVRLGSTALGNYPFRTSIT